MTALRRAVVSAAAIVTLSACAGVVPRSTGAMAAPAPRLATEPSQPVVAKPAPSAPRAAASPALLDGNAASAGAALGPDVASLAISEAAAARALQAFRLSCPALQRRNDISGLTRPGDWAQVCTGAGAARDARRFFSDNFETVRVGPGTAFATGYYEPEIAGSRTRDAAHQVPVYGVPDDLAQIDLGEFSAALKGRTIRGRYLGGKFVTYSDRTEIENGAIDGRARIIAWAADPIEFFFLQVQGSGRLLLPDGGVMRIGYAGQNGRDYTGIGALMRDRGLVGPGQLSMQGIMAWLRANPEQGSAIMRENRSWVFFRELTGAGPVGAMGVAVTPLGSVAADPAFVTLGAPVWLDLDRAEASGLWVAQDTGGAIKGANRFDTFWGAGDEARRIAGGMSGRGTALILLPRGTLARNAADATRPKP